MYSDEVNEATRVLEQACVRFRSAFRRRSERPWHEFRKACEDVDKALCNLEKARRS